MRRIAVRAALDMAYHTAKNLTEYHGRVVREGSGFGEAENDKELAADRLLADNIIEALLMDPTPQIIRVENREPIKQVNAQIMRAVDPLDGSLNFRRRQGSFGLPFASVIAEFACTNPTFGQYRTAGVIDLRNKDLWMATKDQGCTLNGKHRSVSDAKKIDMSEGTMIVADFYYPSNRDLVALAFRDYRGYLRSPGAAGYELALVASGSVDLYVSEEQKCDVLGAGYALVTEAGGVVVDFDGKDIGSLPYEFDAQIPVIAAASRELAMEAVERLKNAAK